MLDKEACSQANQFGLILVEGFFDVAKLVEAGCRNVGTLMGSAISKEQIGRLIWLRSHVRFAHILSFFDRDQAGHQGAGKIQDQLQRRNLDTLVFDWSRQEGLIPASVKDPADMSVYQLRRLRCQGII